MKLGESKLIVWTSRLAAAVIACLVVSNAAHADTLVDPLDNWNQTAGHSPGVVLDNDNSDKFFGDKSRAKCDGTAVASFYYHLPDITSFSVMSYYFSYEGGVEVYVSSDDVTWNRIEVSLTKPKPTTSDTSITAWRFSKIEPIGALPPNTNFIGFTLRNDLHNVFTPEIGQVTIDYGSAGDIAKPGPRGLSILAGDNQALLTWYPFAGARSYTIKRKTVSGSKYEVVATGVQSTSYLDKGLDDGVKYYYTVIGETKEGPTGKSDEVLAVPRSNVAIFHDSLADWSLTASHTANLALTSFDTGSTTKTDPASSTIGQIAKRTSDTRESITYKLPGAATFDVNVYSTEPDPSSAINPEVSSDGSSWTPVSLVFNLPAKLGPQSYGTVCTPDSPLPKGTNFIRLDLGADGMPADSPEIADVRVASDFTESK